MFRPNFGPKKFEAKKLRFQKFSIFAAAVAVAVAVAGALAAVPSSRRPVGPRHGDDDGGCKN